LEELLFLDGCAGWIDRRRLLRTKRRGECQRDQNRERCGDITDTRDFFRHAILPIQFQSACGN
jgi:hypothetical protein